MKLNRFQALLLMGILGGHVPSFAQSNDSNQNPIGTKASSPKESDRQLPSATALGSIFFKSENSLIFSLGAQGSATDNLYFSPAGSLVGSPVPQRGYIPFTTLTGRVAYQRQLQRATVGLDYGVFGHLFRERDSSDFVGQDGGFDLSYRLTPRAKFSVGDRLSISPAPGRFYRYDTILPAVSPQILPNSTLLVGLNRTTSNTALVDLSYQLSKRADLTFGFDGTIIRFQQKDLSETNQAGGHLKYSYRVAERTTLSVGYRFYYYDFSSSQTSTAAYTGVARNHLGYVGINQQLTPAIGLFVQVGPSYIVGNALGTSGVAGQRPGLRASVNGGLTLGQAISLDPRTFFSINAGQNISDGYGFGGITKTQFAGVSLGRRVTKKLTGSVHSDYTRNQFLLSLDEHGDPVTTNGISAGANLSFNAMERLNLFANYIYFKQLSNGFLTLIPGHAGGNTFTVGLSYHFPVFF